ncbi:MAG: serine hydrolase [Saprospiraceae bacterium]
MKYFLLIILLANIFLFNNCSSTSPVPTVDKRIDSIFSEYNLHTPGCAMAIVQHGKLIYKKGYGLANMEYDIPITTTSIFDIASVSKQFTGLAISTLIQEGKIALDDDIRKYLPEVPDFGHVITIKHLLHHTSGLRDWPSTLNIAGWRWDETFSFADIIRMVKQQKDLDFLPGDRHSYSNTGYNLLALIVEKVSGASFRSWTQEHIFSPLKMSSSSFQDDPSRVIKNMVYSYTPRESGYTKNPNALTALGSSSLYTSVHDLILWVNHFNEQLKSKNPVYVNMLNDGILNNKDSVHYGYGLGLGKQGKYRIVSHTGGWAGYRTIITNFPEEELSIIVLGNRADFNPNAVANRIVEIMLPEFKSPSQPVDTLQHTPTIILDTVLAKKYAGLYKLGEHWFVKLTLENGQLMTQANGESKFPMLPKSTKGFWIEAYGSSMHFIANADGSVDSLIYRNYRAPRVTPTTASTLPLSEYIGTYNSEELSTSYKLDLKDKVLWLHHFRLGDMMLSPDPITSGQFSTDIGQVEFDQDNGKITGLRVSGGRIKNIRFTKTK